MPIDLTVQRAVHLLDQPLDDVLLAYPITCHRSLAGIGQYRSRFTRSSLRDFIEFIRDEEEVDEDLQKPPHLPDFLSAQDNVISVMYHFLTFFDPRPTPEERSVQRAQALLGY